MRSDRNRAVLSRASTTVASRSRRVLAVLAVGALAASACGGDDDEDSSAATDAPATTTAEATTAPAATTAETTAAPEATTAPAATTAGTTAAPAAPPTGEPIKLMSTGTIESPVFSIPSIPLGAQLAVDEINAAGGINGRPLELVVCNDELDPNKASSCVQTAVQEGVVALVGGLSVFEPLLVPLISAEDIPWIGLASGSDFDSPVLFPVGADGASAFAGIGQIAMARGCTNPAVIISASGTPLNNDSIVAGIEANGGTVAIELQAAGTDFAPLVESALDAGADCIATGVSPAELGPLLAAVEGRVPVTAVDGSLPAALLGALGNAADGVQVVSGFLLPGSDDPEVMALQEAAAATAPDVSVDHFFFTGYSSVYIAAEVLGGLDEVTPQAVLEGLSSITDFDTGVGPVVDFSTPNSVAGFSRVFNPLLYVWEIKDGKYTLLQDDPIDVQPALELLGQ